MVAFLFIRALNFYRILIGASIEYLTNPLSEFLIMKKVLVACEESQAVTLAFRERGFEAYSLDIKPCTGGHPEFHIQGDALDYINDTSFDLMIAHPPCTHLACSGARHFQKKIADGRQQQGIDLFMAFTRSKIKHFAIENPVGIMSNLYRKPDQIIQPYFFGDEAVKTTCMWTKNLPNLKPTKIVGKGEIVTYASGNRMSKWYADISGLTPEERSTMRSKTFPGIAAAIAQQWGDYIMGENGTYQPDIFDVMNGED